MSDDISHLELRGAVLFDFALLPRGHWKPFCGHQFPFHLVLYFVARKQSPSG